MGIKTVLEEIGMVLLLLFFLFFIFGICYLFLTSGNLFMVSLGVLILLLVIGVLYLEYREDISSLFTSWREKKRERKRREKKVVKEIPPPKKRKKETEIKETKPKTPISVELVIKETSSKGEIMKELGLSYEKPKKTEIKEEKEIEPAISQLAKKDELLKRKRLLYLQSTGIAQSLIEKGELEISRHWHIGEMRGADIAEKLIRPILRDLQIKFEIKRDEGKTKISVNKEGRERLRKEIEKLER